MLLEFELSSFRRVLRVPWTARRSNQSILKEINHEYLLALMLKLQYFGHLIWRTNLVAEPWCWERLKAKGKGAAEDEMVVWHHQVNGHEFEQTPGDSGGQGSLGCCSPGGHWESNTTEWLNNRKISKPVYSEYTMTYFQTEIFFSFVEFFDKPIEGILHPACNAF